MSSSGVIYMVGPSGAGKDSLLNGLRQHVQRCLPPPALHFAQRTITRGHDKSNEDHEAVDVDEFARLQAAGVFALHWQAHGLCYGLRRTQIVQDAGWVIVNGSRDYAAQARALLPGLVVLHVSAPEAALRARLGARQRETPAQVQARIARGQTASVALATGDISLVNDGVLEHAALQLCKLLQARTGLQLLPAA